MVIVLLGIVTLGAGLLALQFDRTATSTARYLATTFNPLPGTELTVGGASGSWIGSLRLTDVTLTRLDSTRGERVRMAHVDTLSARYRLLPLLQQHLHLTDVRVAGPSVTLRQQPDSSWDWNEILPATEEDTSASAFTVDLDQGVVARGAFNAAFYAQGRDSTARIRDVRVAVRDVRAGADVAAVLDTLGFTGRLPGDATDLRFASRAALSSQRLRLDTLLLTSTRSEMRGGGTVHFATSPKDSLDDVSLRVRAEPLSFRDLDALLPLLGLDPDESVRFDLRVTGEDRLLRAEANARFDNGGRLDAAAAATPALPDSASTSPLRYRVQAQARNLTTSLLGPRDPAENRVNAQVDLDLNGASLDALNGTIRASLSRSRLAGLRVDTVGVDADWDGGETELTTFARVNQVAVRLSGAARLLDDVPSYDVTGRFDSLNVAAFSPESGIDSRLSGTLALTGRGTSADDAVATATVDLDPSQVGRARIRRGTVQLDLDPDTARTMAALTLPEGDLRLRGRLSRDASERIALDTLRLTNFNLAAFADDPTPSRITATAQAQLRGFDPTTASGTGTLSVEEATYDALRLTQLEGTTSITRGRLQAAFDAVVNGGTYRAALRGRPFDPRPSLDLTEGRFRNVDVGALAGDTTVSSALNGSLTASLLGTTPDRLQAAVDLVLDSSRVNTQAITRGRLRTSVNDGRVVLSGTLETPDGEVEWQGDASPFETEPRYRLDTLRFSNLDVGALSGTPGLATRLHGSARLDGAGTDPATMTLTSDLTLDSSRVNAASVTSGTLQARLDTGRGSVDGAVDFADGGRVRLRGDTEQTPDAPLAYRVAAQVGRLDLAALGGTGGPPARVDTLVWELDAQGTTLETLAGRTKFATGPVRYDRVRVSTSLLEGTLDAGRLRLDTLSVRSNVFDAVGGGVVAYGDTSTASDFRAVVGITNLRPLQPLVGASRLDLKRGRLTLNVYGAPGTQRFDGRLQAGQFAYNSVRVDTVDVRYNGQRSGEGGLDQAEAIADVGFVAFPSFSMEKIDLFATYDGTGTDLEGAVRVDPKRDLTARGRLQTGAEAQTLTLDSLNLRLGGDRWQLLQPTTLRAGTSYRVRQLLLYSSGQQLAMDGVIDPNGEQNFILTMEDVRLQPLTELVGYEGVGGVASGSLTLSGPAEAPTLDGRVRGTLVSQDAPVGPVRLDVRYDSLAVRLDAQVQHVNGDSLRIEGDVPADLRLRQPTKVDVTGEPVRIDIRTDRFPINWVDPFLDPTLARNVGGEVRAGITVEGTLDTPLLSGTASLANGQVRVPTLSVAYRGASADVRFDEDKARIEDAIVRSSNGGRLRATGDVNFPDLTLGEYDIALAADNFIGIDTRAYRRAIVDGTMTLRGTTQEPVLDGRIGVRSADIYFTEATEASASDLANVALSEEDRLQLERRFNVRVSAADTTTFDAYQAMEIDTLHVAIRSDTWLRSEGTPKLNIQFTGDLDVVKEADEDARVFGSIQVVQGRSTIQQFSQEFTIREGALTFNGDPETPFLNVTAVYQPRSRETQQSEVTITLSLRGRPDDLSTELSSEPQMGTRDILSYLATGRPASQVLSGSGGSRENLATETSIGIATNFVENLASSRLGLDVVRIDYSSQSGSLLTVGRYVTPRLFASIQQPANLGGDSGSFSTPNVTLEYQLTNSLLLQTLNEQRNFQLNLLFEYTY